jgi:dTDP-4-amino-4,6-dideoxy-D-glucose ammonia-lyase
MLTRTAFGLDVDFLTQLPDRLVVPAEVAVVGAGRWAKVMCRVLATFVPPVARIVLVAERNFAGTRAWLDGQIASDGSSGYARVVVVPSLRDVLESDRVEAAFVTKMASEHYATTRQLLLAGKHVLVEKPFVLTAAEATQLTTLAKERQRTLAVGYEFMFAPALHSLRSAMDRHLPDAGEVSFVWEDSRHAVKWGLRKDPDLSANVVTDLYPHILSQLLLLFGDQPVTLRQVTTRDACSDARIELAYGAVRVTATLDKDAAGSRREIAVASPSGRCLRLDYTQEPGQIVLDGRALPPDGLSDACPGALTAEIAYFFAQIESADVMIPNAADTTVHFVEETQRANKELVAAQTRLVKSWLWRDMPTDTPETVHRILRHQVLDGALRHGLIDNPKQHEALDRWVGRAFRIVHRLSREPWTTQADILAQEGLDTAQLARLNAAIRDSDFLQNLIVREGIARQYWSSILPLVETGSVDAVLTNTYQFPLRLGIYAAVWCMFSCTFCGRMENPDARYAQADVAPGNAVFDQVFEAMPKGVSTLSLGGGLEPLTNPNLDDVIRSAKRHGHKVPLVTNGYMLTPVYVKRHGGLWDVDVLRISLYGVDEPSYLDVTKKPGAFQLVKNNVMEFLKERQRRGGGPRVGFNFIVLVNTTDEVLRLLDLIAEINQAVGGPGIDFLTLREDFSIREGEGLTEAERQRLVDIFQEFKEKRRRLCPDLSVDYGYALYPLSEGTFWKGLAMVGHDRMLPKAYPQVSVALDLLGDVYLYRDAAFPQRPGADRYKIGTITSSRSLEMVVRDFIANGRQIAPTANDTWLMDAFDHVVTNLIWQAEADERIGIPFSLGPVTRRAHASGRVGDRTTPAAVNYWQGLFGV